MTVSTYSSVNQAANTAALAIGTVLRAALLAAGWTQVGSGDGSTFSNAGAGPVANGGSGATGLDNSTAWVRWRDPAGAREILFQRIGSNTFSLWYSYGARFTGGSPSATVRPTASDEQQILNSANFTSTTPAYAHAVVESVAINGVYGFWLMRTVQSTSVRMDFIACDPLSNVSDETRYGVLGTQIDPCVWLTFNGTASPQMTPTSLSSTSGLQILINPTQPGRSMLPVTCARIATNNGSGNAMADGSSAPAGMGTNDYDGNDDLEACLYVRFVNMGSGNPGAVIGYSHHMSLKTIAARQYPDVVQHGSSDLAWVYYSTLAIPWPKGTAPSA